MALDPDLKALASDRNFAALTTLMPDGRPQTQVMWVSADDEHVLINTEVHRAKYKNASRDPRVTVTVWDAANPYRYVEARGRVVGEVRGDAARAHIDELSQRYEGIDYPTQVQSERIILKIAPETLHKNNIGSHRGRARRRYQSSSGMSSGSPGTTRSQRSRQSSQR